MKLYMVPLAPNPTKVCLYLAERGSGAPSAEVEQIVVNTLKGRHKEPEHLARNPFGTLPVLELDDGTYIRESLPIIEYFEDKYPDGALRADTPEAIAVARDIERIVDLRIASPLGNYVHAVKSPIGLPPNPERAAELKQNAQAGLDFLENELADGRPLLAGDQVSIADCTLQATCQFLRFIEADVIGDRPRLRKWDERYRARAAAQLVLQW